MLQKMEAMEQNLMEPLKKARALGSTKEEIERNIIEPLVLQALSHGQSQQASVASKEVQSGPRIPGIQVVPVNPQSSKSTEPERKIPGVQRVPVIRPSQSVDANVPKPQIVKQIPEHPSQIVDTVDGSQTSQQLEWIDVIPENGGRSGDDSIDSVAILRYRVSYPENGRFQYEYETENGIKQRSEGYPGSEGQSNMRGAFSWPMEDGVASFSYEADENGYRVESNMLPVAPPAPAHVAGLIAMAQEQRAKGIVFN